MWKFESKLRNIDDMARNYYLIGVQKFNYFEIGAQKITSWSYVGT